jgi:hypothetical protein
LRSDQSVIGREEIRVYAPVNSMRLLGQRAGFHCYCIPAPAGLRPDSYDAVRVFLQELIIYHTARLGYSHESFLHIGPSADRSVTHLFADHARKWFPEVGLGVWPHRTAPRMWKAEDLEEMDPASGMAPLLYTLNRVTADAAARLDAMITMTGTGSALQIVSRAESSALFRDLKELFLDFIEDRVFRIFPWYVPLIEMAVLAEPATPLALDAMQNISIYIRDSPEDGGILIVSAEQIEEILPRLGCEQIEFGPTPVWRLGA